MSWERFGYICRKASVDISPDESVANCLSRIESEESCQLYGGEIEKNNWPGKLLEKIKNIKDQQEATEIIQIYSKISSSNHFEEPLRFKRVTAYLAYVISIFFVTTGIYQLYVAPNFQQMYVDFDIALPPNILFYQQNWSIIAVIITILLISSLLIGFRLKSLFKFKLQVEHGFIMRYLVMKSIKQSYSNVLDILCYPLSESENLREAGNTSIINHLNNIKQSRMNLAEEMRLLIEIEMRTLLLSSEKEMKNISVIIALIVISAIFFFLASAYSPIFILGETI